MRHVIDALKKQFVSSYPIAQLAPWARPHAGNGDGQLENAIAALGYPAETLVVHDATQRVVIGEATLLDLRRRGVTHAPALLLSCNIEIARSISLANRTASRDVNDAALGVFLAALRKDPP